MRILIVSTWWPPKRGIALERPLAWARSWSAAGHHVTVLTERVAGEADSTHWLPDKVAVKAIPNPLRGTSAAEVAQNPREAAHKKHAKRWDRLLRPIVALVQPLSEKTGILRSGRMPDPQSLWARRALRAVAKTHWDLVISTSGPYPVHYIGYKLRSQNQCTHWAADFRDLWVDNHIYPGLFPFTVWERRLESRWMQCADSIVTVSEPLAATMRAKYPHKVLVSPNGFSAADYNGALPDDPLWRDGRFHLVYTGTFYPNLYTAAPLIEILKATLQHAGSDSLRLDLFGKTDALVHALRNAGLDGIVINHGMVERGLALQAQREASALLFFGATGSAGRGVLTGKSFEYLCTGRPILALGVDAESDVAELLDLGIDSLCSGSATPGITKKLLALMQDPSTRAPVTPNLRIPEAVRPFERTHVAMELLERLCPG